ncbi:MAG TPA: DinB family protein [Polyangia bacterium]|jgi:hypothetical protein|nr:DinB family protein [Polyangia bacterium]
MSSPSLQRPDASEYAPHFEKYVSLVPAGDILATLATQLEETLALVRGLSESQGDHRYAPGKWSVKEVLGHVIDTERTFAYRALRFGRNDLVPLPGFDQNEYVSHASFDRWPLQELAAEFGHVRHSHILFFRHLEDAAWQRRGVASGHEVSVRALAYITAGHAAHHVRILRERYL